MMTIAPNPLQPRVAIREKKTYTLRPRFKNIQSVNGNETPRRSAASTRLPPLTSHDFHPAKYVDAIAETGRLVDIRLVVELWRFERRREAFARLLERRIQLDRPAILLDRTRKIPLRAEDFSQPVVRPPVPGRLRQHQLIFRRRLREFMLVSVNLRQRKCARVKSACSSIARLNSPTAWSTFPSAWNNWPSPKCVSALFGSS